MAGNKERSATRNLRRRRRRQRRLRRRRLAAAKQRDWAELTRDVLTLIFRKVGAVGVLHRAQAVCRPWRQLAQDPEFWRIIDMRADSSHIKVFDMEEPTRIAVDLSAGRLEEFYIEHFGSDHLLNYVADRSAGLRLLVLISPDYVSDDGLVEFVTRCPLLEELQITNCSFGDGACRKVGLARPELKCFRLNTVYYKVYYKHHCVEDDEEEDYLDNVANEIADSMPQLRGLQLIGNHMTNKGLHTILNKCLQLESLDIRACFDVKVDASLRAKLSKIKNVKLPDDSTAGYEFETYQEEETSSEEYYSGYSDSSLSSDDQFEYSTDLSYDDFTAD